MAIRVGFLLLASLSGVTADGYDLGGEDAICWLTQTTLATNNPNGTLPDRVQLNSCPTGTYVSLDTAKPTALVDNIECPDCLDYTMHVNLENLIEAADGIKFVYGSGGCSDVVGKDSELVEPFTPFVMDTDETDGDGTNDIGHANVHSCGNQVGFCIPFIGNDGELATHTSASKDSWGWDNVDSPNVGSVTFGSDIILSKDYSPYTIIAHGRFEFTGADGAKWRMDMAAAHLGVVVKPQTREKTLDMGVIMIGTIVAALALLFQVGLMVLTMMHYSNKIMKLSQVNVLVLMIFAAVLGILIVMLTFGSVSDSMCPMKGFVTVPLTFMVGLLYGKVKRVLLLTQIKLLGANKVTSYYVLGWACALTLPQLLIAVISMASDPLVKTEVWAPNEIDFWYECRPESGSDVQVFTWLMLAYSFFILILGVFYARMSSSLASYFNEASYIAIIMYSISLLAFIAVPVAFAIEGAFEAQFLVTTLAICMGVCVTTGVMIIPKILLIKDKNVKVSASGLDLGTSGAGATTGATATTATTATAVNNSAGGVKTVKIKNFFKKGDMKEVAVTLCDELFKEVQHVKGKYDNMFAVSKEEMQKVIDVMEKITDLGKDGEDDDENWK